MVFADPRPWPAALLLGLILICIGCPAAPRSAPANVATTPAQPTTTSTAITPNGDVIALELAADAASRQQGMMGRREAPAGTGMLFVFDRAGRHSFWMFQCLIALDIVWLDDSRTVIHVGESLPPCDGPANSCPMYGPDRDARYVLEVAGGTARSLGIVPGARLLLNLPPGLEVR